MEFDSRPKNKHKISLEIGLDYTSTINFSQPQQTAFLFSFPADAKQSFINEDGTEMPIGLRFYSGDPSVTFARDKSLIYAPGPILDLRRLMKETNGVLNSLTLKGIYSSGTILKAKLSVGYPLEDINEDITVDSTDYNLVLQDFGLKKVIKPTDITGKEEIPGWGSDTNVDVHDLRVVYNAMPAEEKAKVNPPDEAVKVR